MIEKYREMLDKIRTLLRKNPRGLTITQIATNIKLNRNSTARYLDVLQISGHVEMKNVGSAKLYFLSQRVPIEAMLDLSKDGILMLDSELNIIKANENFGIMVGIDCHEILGMKFDQMHFPGLTDAQPLSTYSDGVSGKQTNFEMEIWLEERPTYFNVKIVPTTFDDGSTGATIILEDITEKRKVEEEIQHQRDFLKHVMESVAHPFYVIDANDYTIKMANRAARLGHLSGASTCYALTHKTSQPCSGEVHPCPLRKVKKTKKPAVVEHVHHHVSGRTRYVEIHAHPIFDDHGNVIQMIEYNLDITERKQIEEDMRRILEMYQIIVEYSNDGIFVVQDEKIIFCNVVFAEMLNYGVHELTGLDLSSLVGPDDLQRISKIICRKEAKKLSPKNSSFTMRNKKQKQVAIKARTVYVDYNGYPASISFIKQPRPKKT